MNKQKIVKFSIYAAAILVAGGVLAYRRGDVPIHTIVGTPMNTVTSGTSSADAEIAPTASSNFEERRLSQLITSPNSSEQLIFDAGYSTITVHGKTNSKTGTVEEIFLARPESYENTAPFTITQKDGQIEGSISFLPNKTKEMFLIYVKFNRGANLSKYVVKYDEKAAEDTADTKIGYYFPDNGLAEKNIAVLSKVRNTPADAVKIYIAGENGDDAAVRETLEEIKKLGVKITKGHDSDYEKSRAISEWVSQNIYYDDIAHDKAVRPDTIALSNILKNHRTICYGFANFYAALCQSVGVKTICVDGAAEYAQDYDRLLTGGNEHCSNAYYDDKLGRYVLVDAGWDTSSIYDGKYIFGEPYPHFFDGSPLSYSFTHRFINAYYIDFFGI